MLVLRLLFRWAKLGCRRPFTSAEWSKKPALTLSLIGVVLLVLLATAACSGEPVPPTPSGGTSPPSVSATGTVLPAAGAPRPSPSDTEVSSAGPTVGPSPQAPQVTVPAAASSAVVPTPGTSNPVDRDPAPVNQTSPPATKPGATPTSLRQPTVLPTPSPTPNPAPSAIPAPQIAEKRSTQLWLQRPVDFLKGQATGVQTSSQDGVRLARQGDGYGAGGEYLSEVEEAAFPFDNAVMSWNADAPAGTVLRFDLRVRDAGGWSGWYGMGEWRDEGGRSVSGQGDGRGRVDVDTLKLNSVATALQYRVKLSSTAVGASPLLRQVGVVYSNLRNGLVGPAIARPAGAARDLEVPGHSQLEEDPAVATKICSPTSLAMVMQYWGSKKTVAQVLQGVRDATSGIFGNWTLNAAFAGANGLEAVVDRFYSVEQLEQQIAAGRPAIISVAYAAGELDGAATRSTDGHLIVVRGFTAAGDVIVNDPIAPNSKSVRLVYKRGQLERIWLRSGGVVYLVSPRS